MICTDINNWLKDNLTEERYAHSLGTAECARELAKRFGVDEEKAYFTGLIHDCAKCLSKDKTMEILKNMKLLCRHKTLSQQKIFSACIIRTHVHHHNGMPRTSALNKDISDLNFFFLHFLRLITQ